VLQGGDDIRALVIDDAFTYVGAQRFMLRDVADAEQHFFAVSSPDGSILRLYWIQFESLLEGSQGSYDRRENPRVMHDGVVLLTDARRVAEPPQPDSDRGKAALFLKEHGLGMPLPAVRAHLVRIRMRTGDAR
jgi:hypothetical protein